jgi:tryptophan synthase alpha chain
MFENPTETGEARLIAFLMAGHPSLEWTERLSLALIDEGISALELGVPFSDALADGPVIQLAAQKALENQVSLRQVLELAARLHEKKPQIPLIIFSYLNPILSLGLPEYVRLAKEAGVSATLAVDLPPEEAEEFCELHARAGLQTVFLASPTTSRERLRKVDQLSTGFIYVVSRTGVTGVQTSVSETLAQELAQIRSVSSRHLAVGFGISTAAQAREVAKIADGVIVGSAFVKLIEQESEGLFSAGVADFERAEKAIRALACELRRGIREAHQERVF